VISPTTYEPIRCAICGRDRFGHRRDNGVCMAFERAEHAPVAARTRQRPVASAGWRLR
jgi:hypothetical protein